MPWDLVFFCFILRSFLGRLGVRFLKVPGNFESKRIKIPVTDGFGLLVRRKVPKYFNRILPPYS